MGTAANVRKESHVSYRFEGPVSFSSMTAQAFLRFGFHHAKAEQADWIFRLPEMRDSGRLLFSGERGVTGGAASAAAASAAAGGKPGISSWISWRKYQKEHRAAGDICWA